MLSYGATVLGVGQDMGRLNSLYDVENTAQDAENQSQIKLSFVQVLKKSYTFIFVHCAPVGDT